MMIFWKLTEIWSFHTYKLVSRWTSTNTQTFVLGFMQKLCKSGYCLDLTDVTTRKQEKCSKFLCYSLHNGKVGSQHWPLNIWKIKLRKRLINWGKLSYSIAQIFTDFKLIVFWGRYLQKVFPNIKVITKLCALLAAHH